MVIAVDMGLMSTSRNERTPIAYMHEEPGRNVLWQLMPKAESDAGFHRGANISIVSQFACEEEVLFPPCTMLRVLPRVLRDGDGHGQLTRWNSGLDTEELCSTAAVEEAIEEEATHEEATEEGAIEEDEEEREEMRQRAPKTRRTSKGQTPYARFRVSEQVVDKKRFLRVVVLPYFL